MCGPDIDSKSNKTSSKATVSLQKTRLNKNTPTNKKTNPLYSILGATMRLQDLGSLQFYGTNLEALTQGAIITILAIAIVLSNLLIIATYLNFKGK